MSDGATRKRPRKRPPSTSAAAPADAGTPSELVVRDDFVAWLEAEYQKARREAEKR